MSEPGNCETNNEILGNHEETLLVSGKKETNKDGGKPMAADCSDESLKGVEQIQENFPDKIDNSLAQEEDETEVSKGGAGDIEKDAEMEETGPTATQVKVVKDKCRSSRSGDEKFSCEHCKKAFHRKTNLDKHTQLKHRTEIGSPFPEENGKIYYPCNQCQDSFPCKRNLERHVAKKHKSKDNERRFICDICSKTFKRQGRLDRHLQFVHAIEKEISLEDNTKICNICSKFFATTKNLITHKRNIHGSKNQVVCHDCGKYFKYKILLQNHIKNVHEITNDQCKECNKICKNKFALEKHMSYNHS